MRCVNIRCPLRGLDSKASLVLRSRLWNSTFLEVWLCPPPPRENLLLPRTFVALLTRLVFSQEYSKLNYLDILVRASIDVTAAAQNIKLPHAGTQVRSGSLRLFARLTSSSTHGPQLGSRSLLIPLRSCCSLEDSFRFCHMKLYLNGVVENKGKPEPQAS